MQLNTGRMKKSSCGNKKKVTEPCLDKRSMKFSPQHYNGCRFWHKTKRYGV